MRNTKAIFLKQWMSQLKSPVMLVQAGIFLAMVLVFTFLFDESDCYDCVPAVVCYDCEGGASDMPTPNMAGMFAVIFVGMAMISSASGLVAEDKSTHNFRFMAMADVKPHEYLLGTTAAVWFLSIGVLVLYALVGRNFGMDFLWFMAITVPGALVSVLLGLAIATSKAPWLTMPLSFLYGMGPMLAAENESLAAIIRFTSTQQVRLSLADSTYLLESFTIIALNGVGMILLLAYTHRKGKLLA